MISTDDFDLLISLENRKIGSKSTDVFISTHIFENAGKGIPVAEIRFSCRDVIDIYDGMPVDISLTIKRNSKSVFSLDMPFRVFSYRTYPMESGDVSLMDIVCVFRSIPLISTSTFSIKGTSSKVFNYFSSLDKGLKVETDDTRDSQVWSCVDERGFVFLQKVSRRAWASPTSCFVTAFTKTGKVRLYDLSKRLSTDYVAVFLPDTTDFGLIHATDREKLVLYKSLEVEASAGILNYIHTYNTTWMSFNVEKGTYNIFNPKSAMASSQKVLLNKDYLESRRREILPLNVGNVHPNYYLAEAQNSRLRTLYSVNAKVGVNMTYLPYPLDLLDRVKLVVTRLPEHLNKRYTGNYFIEKCVTSIEGTSIYQNYMLIREGVF